MSKAARHLGFHKADTKNNDKLLATLLRSARFDIKYVTVFLRPLYGYLKPTEVEELLTCIKFRYVLNDARMGHVCVLLSSFCSDVFALEFLLWHGIVIPERRKLTLFRSDLLRKPDKYIPMAKVLMHWGEVTGTPSLRLYLKRNYLYELLLGCSKSFTDQQQQFLNIIEFACGCEVSRACLELIGCFMWGKCVDCEKGCACFEYLVPGDSSSESSDSSTESSSSSSITSSDLYDTESTSTSSSKESCGGCCTE